MPVAPIGTAGSLARVDHIQTAYMIRKNFTFADGGKSYFLGYVPANSWLKRTTGLYVSTAFNSGTTNTVDIGTAGSATAYASALASGSTGDKILSAAVYIPVETAIFANFNNTGTAATTGVATVIVEYYPDL